MVFRGRPSKACQRCRDRRLKCDLAKGSCGPCTRKGVKCTGYRDTQQLRVHDETVFVQTKQRSKTGHPYVLQSLPLPLEHQARDAFFLCYVNGSAKTWTFLNRLYDPASAPEHLTSTIDAVSLAYFSHQVNSPTALMTGRRKYVSALHKTSRALQRPESGEPETTLLVSLLLDLFEKITHIESHHSDTWLSHVKGALALANNRGLDNFRSSTSLEILARLSNNLLISYVAADREVPASFVKLRCFLEKRLSLAEDSKWRLSSLMVKFANLRGRTNTLRMSSHAIVEQYLDLDREFEILGADMISIRPYFDVFPDHCSKDMIAQHYTVYPDRHSTQTWNVLRLVKILISESIFENLSLKCEEMNLDRASVLLERSKSVIEAMAYEICASTAQYTDCGLVLSSGGMSTKKCLDAHSPDRKLNCHTLIFPLFVAANSSSSPSSLKQWVSAQLHHMSDHFGMPSARLVAQILDNGTTVNPWTVYAMLGGYAFAT